MREPEIHNTDMRLPATFAGSRQAGAIAMSPVLEQPTNISALGETDQNSTGYLSPEFIETHEGDWTDREGKQVWIACGDERPTAQASAANLSERAGDTTEVLPITEGGLSVFGQVAGIAKNALVVGVAQYGESFYDTVNGYDGMLEKTIRLMRSDKGSQAVLPAFHSDATKEKAAAQVTGKDVVEGDFCAHGNGALGCAYCMLAGAVSDLVAHNEDVQTVGADNIKHVFGYNTDDLETEQLIRAQQYVANRLTKDFSVNRGTYIASKLPVQVLAGVPHLPAAETGVIANLDPTSVGKAGSIYRQDVAGATLLVRRLFREYDLKPQMIIKSQLLEGAAVRTALASHDASGDTTPDPRRLAFGVRGGDVQTALQKIAELEQVA